MHTYFKCINAIYILYVDIHVIFGKDLTKMCKKFFFFMIFVWSIMHNFSPAIFMEYCAAMLYNFLHYLVKQIIIMMLLSAAL